MIKLAITDDHPLVIQGLKDLLSGQKDIQVVGGFNNVASTRKGLSDSGAQVLLLDINLPDGNGIDLCAELLESNPELAVIGLTSHEEVHIATNLLKIGAKGFLLKTVDKIQLIEAIHTVASGVQYIQAEMRDRIVKSAIGNNRPRESKPKLTAREGQVLHEILNELTTKEIAESLFLSPKTIESHRAVLFQKFEVRNVAGLVKRAIEIGYS